MDTIQILLLIILIISTIFLTVVGIQIILVLNQIRKTMAIAHKAVEGLDSIGSGLKHGLGEATGFINGFKTILRVIDVYKSSKNGKS